jgi:hypothetical protein
VEEEIKFTLKHVIWIEIKNPTTATAPHTSSPPRTATLLLRCVSRVPARPPVHLLRSWPPTTPLPSPAQWSRTLRTGPPPPRREIQGPCRTLFFARKRTCRGRERRLCGLAQWPAPGKDALATGSRFGREDRVGGWGNLRERESMCGAGVTGVGLVRRK